MASKIERDVRTFGRRFRELSGALAVTAVLLSAGVAARSQSAPTFTVLYTFTGGADGANPYAGLVGDKAGNLYGDTAYGGNTSTCALSSFGCGVVFKLDTSGKEIVLYSCAGAADGGEPFARPVAASGNLYGTTYGGSSAGVVFKVDPTGKETVLHSFSGYPTDGSNPQEGGLVRDATGNLYGTTPYGGDSTGCLESGCGAVFKLDPTGSESVLYSFTGASDGRYPLGGLVRDAAGNLYGTTSSGGNTSTCVLSSFGCGVVFKLDTAGQETALYSFTGGADGGFPYAGLVPDTEGNLYGTTYFGGSGTCPNGCGVVFKLDPTGKETVLYNFEGYPDGSNPIGALVQNGHDLYGITTYGGGYTSCFNGLGCGVVFKLDSTGKETVLHDFTGGSDGSNPYVGLVKDSAGSLYGTAPYGGSSVCLGGLGCGVVFKLVLATGGH